MMPYFKRIACLLAVLLLCGCAGVQNSLQKMGLGKGPAVRLTVPRRQLLSADQVPAHVKLAASALVLKMRHKPVPGHIVVFDPKGLHRVSEKYFDYRGFRWTLLDLTAFQSRKIAKNKVAVRLNGLLHFRDRLGRMSSSSFALDYTLQKGRPLRITGSKVINIKPVYPLVKAYFVPLQKFRENYERLKTFNDYAGFAVRYAVSMYATEKQRKAKAQWDGLSFTQKLKSKPPNTAIEGDWAILVFCMDRLAPDSLLDVKVTAGSATAGSSLQPVVFRDHGWRVAVVAGHGFLHDPRRYFAVQVYYQANPQPKSKSVLVGRFYSRLDYSKPERRLGKLNNRERLLNPRQRDDARRIQARLKELGYYRMKIDGAFGPASWAALRSFCRDALHSAECQWNLEVQKVLFKDAGR